MKIKKISKNAAAFVYDNIPAYLTNVFLINKSSNTYIIDTYCGSDSMLPVRDMIENKEAIIINTHFHWDHIWGNCVFEKNQIISHKLCRDLIAESWDTQLIKNSKYITGKVEKTLPNVTFTDKIFFHNDEIELFHSPGHTADSISIFDHEEKILYVGDNLEKPILYVEDKNISQYISTLENYLSYKPKKIVSGHTLYLTEKDLSESIKYLENLSTGKDIYFEDEYCKEIHQQNMIFIKSCN
ncbi:MAG: MBL fold metallo-hydrolase [Bacillota bacterium]|nr:MBL fold metallo-hydrolase [Bacillota bacterium]